MSDCLDAEMRDHLPDALHDRLTPAQRVELDAHLLACDRCRAELALLRQVRDAAPRPRVDTATIAAAIPAYRRRTWSASPLLRIAAALVLVVGSATLIVRRTNDGPVVRDTVAQRATLAPPVLSMGESLQDLSDTDLEALAGELRELEAVLSTEPEEFVVPIGESGT